jgi:shikimate dehydrogenase
MPDFHGKNVVILGAGGAARAIAVEVGLSGAARIDIVNRTEERGQDLVDLLNNRVKISSELTIWEGDYEIPADTEILINATSIGLGDAKARVPIAESTLRKELLVADVIFNPPLTQFMRAANEAGCTTLDGLGMLVNQGVIGFKIWTGVDPDPAVMREALEEFLNI